MNSLVNFLLQQIGLPVISMIIKDYQVAHNGAWPTSEQVVQAFIDDWKKWVAQGTNWLAANPLPPK